MKIIKHLAIVLATTLSLGAVAQPARAQVVSDRLGIELDAAS